jgi:hypothetical protein
MLKLNFRGAQWKSHRFYSKKLKSNPFNVKTNIGKELEAMKQKNEEANMLKEFTESMLETPLLFFFLIGRHWDERNEREVSSNEDVC